MEGKAVLSPVLFFFPSLSSFLAAFQSSEGRPCWVERGSSLSFKSHSLWRLPLRISQRDQRRRGSDRGKKKKQAKEGEKRDRRQTCGKRGWVGGGVGGAEVRLGTRTLKSGEIFFFFKSDR